MWERPLEALRRKWGTIPLSDRREQSASLLRLSDDALLGLWRQERDLEGALDKRGWYRLLYRDTVPGRRILDIGCGFAYDSLTFAEWGAEVTLVDIVEENVELVDRVARLLGLDVRTHYMESVDSLKTLPKDYEVLLAIGSLHNAPADVMRPEYAELSRRLQVGCPRLTARARIEGDGLPSAIACPYQSAAAPTWNQTWPSTPAAAARTNLRSRGAAPCQHGLESRLSPSPVVHVGHKRRLRGVRRV